MPTTPPVAATVAVLLVLGAPASTHAPAAPRADAPTAAADAVERATWRPPVDDPVLGRGFAPPASRWGAGHRGVDLVAGAGTAVRAPAAGTVAFVGRVVDRELVTITHADGLRSTLEPVAVAVATGDVVAAGDVIGALSSGGHCGDHCLHWGVREGESYVDPLSLLGGGPVVLLPLVLLPAEEVRRARPPAASRAGAASRRCASGRCATR